MGWSEACYVGSVQLRYPVPIAVMLNTFDPGGTEHQMTELIARLDRRLFTVHVACVRKRGALLPRVEHRAASIREFRLQGLVSVDTARQMVEFGRWCRNNAIQLVHACDFYANVFALPAAALARVPVRIGSRRDVFIPERRPSQQRAQRMSYRLAHRVVANSTAAANRLQAEGIGPQKVVHIPNGLDVARFASAPALSASPVITTIANLRPGKGHDVLLMAAADVVRRVPDIRFRIVGDGSQRDALERDARALGLERHVEFLGHRDDVPAILQQTSVFAFPSFMEAAPNAVMEAMAAGLPIVATRVGGIPELIEHERNGLLIPAGDHVALAESINRLIDSPAFARQLGAAARQTVDSRYSFDRMTREFQQLYLSELSARVAGVIPACAPAPAP